MVRQQCVGPTRSQVGRDVNSLKPRSRATTVCAGYPPLLAPRDRNVLETMLVWERWVWVGGTDPGPDLAAKTERLPTSGLERDNAANAEDASALSTQAEDVDASSTRPTVVAERRVLAARRVLE